MWAKSGRARFGGPIGALAILTGLIISPARAAPVEIFRDDFGVPYIVATTHADAAFAVAYAQAEDGLESLLRFIVEARGEGYRAYGTEAALNNDLRMQMFRIPQIGRRLYEQASPELRAIHDGFAAGLNHYLTRHPERRPDWFERARGVDFAILGKAYQVNQQVQGTAMQELRRGLQGDASNVPEEGSNMWVVGPSRTANGESLLVADPHLPWTGRTRWWEFQIRVGDRFMHGAGFFGSAYPGLGLTQDIAWASTNNNPDNADVFRVTIDPDDPEAYLFEGRSERFALREAVIDGPDGRLHRHTIRETRHGPVVHEDPGAGVVYAVKVAGLETGDLSRLGPAYFDARTVYDLREANKANDHYMWHRSAIDREGNIAYYFFNATPDRDDRFDWRRPVDGGIAATEWTQLLPHDSLPFFVNPPAGFIQNCNNNPYTNSPGAPLSAADFPRHLADRSLGLSPWSRAYRATELLMAREDHDLESVIRIWRDVKAVAAPRYIAALQAAFEAGGSISTPALDALSVLTAWDLEATLDNEATPILMALVAVAGRIEAIEAMAPAELRAAFEQAVDALVAAHGSGRVPQRKVHALSRGDLRVPVPGAGNESNANPFVSLFMTYSGGLEDGRSTAYGGSSYGLAVRFGEADIEVRSVLPFGNSDDPRSPHFLDQAPLFAAREMKPVPLTLDAIEAAAKSRLVLVP